MVVQDSYKQNLQSRQQRQTIKNSDSGITLHIENFYNNTDKDIERLAYELGFYNQRLSLAKGGD